MMREMFKSKIHMARVTETNLAYMGSITIDTNLLEAADILPGEKVLVVNKTNGGRFETYTFPGDAGSRVICINGAAARLAEPGDEVIIISFAVLPDAEARALKPRVVICDENNNIRKTL